MGAPFQPHSTATLSDPGRGRSVLLLVTGGIAAYKACTIVRRLSDAGCEVQVAMSEAATRFVTPLTFEALSGRPVGTSLWGEGGEKPLDHIQWARQADLVLVAPATADFLAKMALGLANDLPSTLVSAMDPAVPTLAAPAMNDRMWANPPNQLNVARLQQRGVEIIDPGSGWLACGTVAEGRLAEPEYVVERVLQRLQPGPLQGQRVLVTAGGTRERIDAVRFVGNRSSGRMGFALAQAARALGAEVTLLLGSSDLPPPSGVEVQRFESAEDLARLAHQLAPEHGAIVMAAAVGDFRVAQPRAGKWKKADGPPRLELVPTVDILSELGQAKTEGQCLIGFALETGSDADVESSCEQKMRTKQLDLICGNHADRPDEGFGGQKNRLYVLDRRGRGSWSGHEDKQQLAREIWERAIELFSGDRDRPRAKDRAEEAE